jgi:hypothetical protein
MAERMVRAMTPEEFGVEAVYLYGSVKNGTAGPGSDIDLLVHFAGDEDQRRRLDAWFRGWGQALGEMNYSRTGVRMENVLDVTYVSDAEVAAGDGLAAKIGAVTDAARLLAFSS